MAETMMEEKAVTDDLNVAEELAEETAEKLADEPVAAGTKEEVESIQESLVMDVCEAYGRQYTEGDKAQPSMRAVAEMFDISPMKVKKILVTGGLFQTDMSDEIQRLYARGLSVKQIAKLKNTSVANVNTYLPYEKVIVYKCAYPEVDYGQPFPYGVPEGVQNYEQDMVFLREYRACHDITRKPSLPTVLNEMADDWLSVNREIKEGWQYRRG